MAETSQEVVSRRPKPKAGAKTTPLPKALPTQQLAVSAPESAAKPKFDFFRGLMGRKDDVPPAQVATTGKTQSTAGAPAGKAAPPRPGMGRFFFGMSLYMVLALAAQVGLGYLFQQIPGHGTQVLFTLPIIGTVTVAIFTWMVTLIAILFLLYKFNILPRNLAGQPRQKIASVKADPKDSKPAPAKPVREPLSGPNDDVYERVKARNRAERRKARRR
jgi:hypothetical protein